MSSRARGIVALPRERKCGEINPFIIYTLVPDKIRGDFVSAGPKEDTERRTHSDRVCRRSKCIQCRVGAIGEFGLTRFQHYETRLLLIAISHGHVRPPDAVASCE